MVWQVRSDHVVQVWLLEENQRPKLLLVDPRSAGADDGMRRQKSGSAEVVAILGGFSLRVLSAVGAILVKV